METGLNDYIKTGLELDAEHGVLIVDTQKPRKIIVRTVNELTRDEREYILRVTLKGGLCLV